jgi:hypothetical protein
MPEDGELMTCSRCRAEVQPDAIRCRHCGHSLVGEGWLEDVRAYARMTPRQRLEWMRSLSPGKGRRFRQVWKEFGPDAEREVPLVAPGEPATKSEGDDSTSYLLRAGLLVLAGLVLLLLADATESMQAFFGLVLVAAYFLPSLIASKRRHHQIGAIAVINIFLGWTFIGWVIALAMASSAVRPDSGAASGQG